MFGFKKPLKTGKIERDPLESCPFCGGEARYTLTAYGQHGYVFCTICGTMGPRIEISDKYIAKDRAISKWNNRW
jgi:Lar family restriction alleviation protein